MIQHKLRMSLVLMLCLCLPVMTLAADQTAQMTTDVGALDLQIIQDSVLLNKNNIADVKAGLNEQGVPYVLVTLNEDAAKKVAQMSADNLGKEAVIVWNKRVISMAKIQTPLGNELMLFGFTVNEAKQFVAALKGDESASQNQSVEQFQLDNSNQ